MILCSQVNMLFHLTYYVYSQTILVFNLIFFSTGKLNFSLKDLQNAGELWLVKLPRNCRPERMEGQEIILENDAENPLKLNSNGAVQNAQVMKDKFNLPFVCPQKSKHRIALRLEHGLKAEKALHNRVENFEDLEEDADTGKI